MKTISLRADIFYSKPVVALSAEFGIAAQVVIIALLCEIAKNGYFIRWNDLQRNLLSRNTDIDVRQLDLMVARLVEYEYFDPRMLKMTASSPPSRFRNATSEVKNTANKSTSFRICFRKSYKNTHPTTLRLHPPLPMHATSTHGTSTSATPHGSTSSQ